MASTTVRDIASRLGVSPATVSRSLNNSGDVSESLRARVLAEAQRVGYELPRKSVRTGRIGLIYFNETSGPKFSGYDAVIWGGVARAAIAQNYDVSVINSLDKNAGESFDAFAMRKGVEGFVLRVDEDTRHYCSDIARDGVPHVVVADRFEEKEVNYVSCNSTQTSREAVEHLLNLGHRRVAICHNTVLDTDHQDRIAGYRAALNDAGVAVDPGLVIAVNADLGGGAAALNRLLSSPTPPTAVFFTDPALTVGALRRALEVGIRVPEELSVIGVDDERVRKMTHPVFTAVCQNADELGQQAGRWLCRVLAQQYSRKGSRSEGIQMQLDAFLEINHTTAPPPAVPVRISPVGQRMTVQVDGSSQGGSDA